MDTVKKILLVEDDPLLVDVYTTKLKQVGFEVDVVEEGDRVMRAIREKNPDVVLLDIVLPQVDGWEILRSIKTDEATKNVNVIILSNLGQKEEVEKGMNLGAAKYLIKAHYTPSEIVEELQKIIL